MLYLFLFLKYQFQGLLFLVLYILITELLVYVLNNLHPNFQ